MTGYHTEQKKMLLQFLHEHRTEAYTIEEAAFGLKARYGNAAPAKSTVYRLVQRLVEEGEVKRLVMGNSRRFVYQLTDGEACHTHLHMQCRACGRLFHLEERFSHALAQQVAEAEGFTLCESDTVLLGECAACHAHTEDTL